jgi:hypothetical protein
VIYKVEKDEHKPERGKADPENIMDNKGLEISLKSNHVPLEAGRFSNYQSHCILGFNSKK